MYGATHFNSNTGALGRVIGSVIGSDGLVDAVAAGVAPGAGSVAAGIDWSNNRLADVME